MEQWIDNMLEHIFGSISLQLNVMAGVILAIAGIVLLIVAKKRASKGMELIGWICFAAGCLGIAAGVATMLL